MSELAYNQHGDRFDVPPDASFWRVRRFKAPGTRGAPEVVYDDDGLPLSVPIEISMAEFREAVDGVAGRYRLDPTDERGAATGDIAAYIQVRDSLRKNPKSVPDVEDPNDALLRELVRANTEMVKTITEKFAQIMESAAVLVKAADGAGIAARKPLEIPTTVATISGPVTSPVARAEDDDEEADEDQNEDGPQSVLANVLQMALEKAMPLISHAIHTKVMGLSSAQSMALLGHSASNGAVAPKDESPAATARDDSDDAESDDGDDAGFEDDQEVEGDKISQSHSGKPGKPGPLAFVSHLAAIESHLSAEDIDAIKILISNLSADELVQWKDKLLQTPAAEAAVLIVAEVRAREKKGRGT